MKTLFLLSMVLSLWGAAQPFVLLDRNLEQPVQVHATFDLSDIAGGAFPLYAQDLDAIVYSLDTLARKIDTGFALPATLDAAVSEHCSILMWHSADKGADNFSGVLRVSSGNIMAPLSIAKNQNRKTTVRRLKQLADYIRNNRVVVKAAMEAQ